MDPTERKRRISAAEAADLGGWYPSGFRHYNFRDRPHVCLWQYSHLDGREANVYQDGYSTDPELQALLKARAAVAAEDRAAVAAEDRETQPHLPLTWQMVLLLRVLRACARLRRRHRRHRHISPVAIRGGWCRSGLWDGRSRDGRRMHGQLYSHPDGRRAFVSDGSYCSDPELKTLLTAAALVVSRAAAEDREKEPRPWFWRAMDLVRRVLRAWARRPQG